MYIISRNHCPILASPATRFVRKLGAWEVWSLAGFRVSSLGSRFLEFSVLEFKGFNGALEFRALGFKV